MKAIVFIHGYLTNPDDFYELPNEVRPYYDETIIFKLPGHGKEPNVNISDFTYKNVINYIETNISQIFNKYDTVDLVGFSLGGAISRSIATRYPVHKLVLIAPACKYMSFTILAGKIKALYDLGTDERLDVNDKLNEVKTTTLRVKDDIKFGFKVATSEFNLANGLAFVKIVKHYNEHKNPITAPTLIFGGLMDELVPMSSIYKCYNDCINPQKEVVEYRELGHFIVKSDKYQEVASKIKSFLEINEK